MSNKTDENAHLNEVIDNTLTYLGGLNPDTDAFAHVTDQLTKLYALAPKKEPWVKPDVLVPVLGNLAGIVSILGYEHVHVITSKALGFVIKTKI